MDEKERELFERMWRFLSTEAAADRGFRVKRIVIGEVPDAEQSKDKKETA